MNFEYYDKESYLIIWGFRFSPDPRENGRQSLTLTEKSFDRGGTNNERKLMNTLLPKRF